MAKAAASRPRRSSPGKRPEPAAPGLGFIVSPVYDALLFLLPPAFALGLGFLITTEGLDDLAHDGFVLWGRKVSWSVLFIAALTHAHLVAVFFRSHGNPKIRKRYPARFFLVPVALYGAMLASPWVLISVSVLATFWDVYHSALQTFGFARIYDARQGNDPSVGRRLDWWLNQLLYVGPIVAGATMIDHFDDFQEFESLGTTLFTAIPVWMQGHQATLVRGVLGAGSLFLVGYVVSYWRLSRAGYRVSWLKVYLLASTGAVSIYAWGFNSWGEAFFIMNFFHALQYFGIVWAREKKNMMRLFGLAGSAGATPVTLALFLGLTFGYGIWAGTVSTDITSLWALTLVVSIMHFWYDGFIWSVQRKQV